MINDNTGIISDWAATEFGDVTFEGVRTQQIDDSQFGLSWYLANQLPVGSLSMVIRLNRFPTEPVFFHLHLDTKYLAAHCTSAYGTGIAANPNLEARRI